MKSVNTSAGARVARYTDVPPQPWANGGGITRVMAVGWAADSDSAFDWRISIADVASGAFSTLAGVDRIITLCEGPALALTIDGVPMALAPFRPHRFAGESHAESRIDAATRDFNVMTRRDRCTATVDIRAESGQLGAPPGSVTCVLPLRGTAELRLAGGGQVALGRYDTVVLTGAAELRASGADRVAVVGIRAHHGSLRTPR